MTISEGASSPRRQFLKTAGVLAVGTAAVGNAACHVKEPAQIDESTAARTQGFDRALLDALAGAVLPAAIGEVGRRAAVDRFVAWADAYDPVAEEMHGYGYSEIRYLPADPAPAWRAQLEALDLLSQRMLRMPFLGANAEQRQAVVSAALRDEGGERLPAPLGARHVAVALLSHWAASPDAWNLALGAAVNPGTCRTLDDARRAPLPIAAPRPAPRAAQTTERTS